LAVLVYLLPRDTDPAAGAERPTMTPPRVVQFSLLDAQGKAAVGAGAVLLQPEVAGMVVDDSGLASAFVLNHGPLEFVAWLDGHQLLRVGPVVPDSTRAFSFTLSPELPDQIAALDIGEPRKFSFTCRPEQTLENALLVIHLRELPDAAPWVATLDAQGTCHLKGIPSGELIGSIYAPGMPPVEVCAMGHFSSAATQARFELETTQVILQDYAPGSIWALTHLGEKETQLPQFQVQESGALTLPPLPRNQRFRIAGPDSVEEFETTAGVYRIRCSVPANK